MTPKKKYSDPKLYIAKKKSASGKTRVPDLSKDWYVYFYFDDPVTKKRGKQPFKIYKDINSFHTVEDRRAAGEAWCKVVKRALGDGFDPHNEKSAINLEIGGKGTVKDVFLMALELKKSGLKKKTYESYKDYLRMFLSWAETKGIDRMKITELTDVQVIAYLNHLAGPKPKGKALMPTTVANHKRNLSTLMTKMVDDRIIPDNFIAKIKRKNNAPLKNEPLTMEEFENVRAYSKEHLPLLYTFLRIMFYTFMRNGEILETKIKHIDMEKRVIAVETKRETRGHILMIEPIYQYLLSLKLHKYNKEDYLFTLKGRPGPWNAKLKTKEQSISYRFAKVREHFGIDKKKTSYSLRHNAVIILFKSFVEDEGLTEAQAISKLIQITRHKDESSLRAYLRNIGAILPKDWTDRYNVKF